MPRRPKPPPRPKVPKRYKIAGEWVRIRVARKLDGYFGYYDVEKREIVLAPHVARDRALLRDTLWHETMESAFFLTGMAHAERFDQEPVIRMLEQIWKPAMERLLARI